VDADAVLVGLAVTASASAGAVVYDGVCWSSFPEGILIYVLVWDIDKVGVIAGTFVEFASCEFILRQYPNNNNRRITYLGYIIILRQFDARLGKN
jgi:hypothetical protein